MSAKGKELRVSTSVNRATALGNSSGELPNVMYFPTDDPNSIIFNGRIYDLNRLITAPVILDDAKSLDTYKGISNAGVYVGKSGNKISNKPGGVDAFILQAFSYLPNEIHYQILYSGNKIYSRRYVESSSLWTPWEKLGAEGLTSIPKATTSALGGVMLGYTNSGRNYKLELDSNGKAFVNVPWTNTTYSNATTEMSGLMSTSDKSDFDEIRADWTNGGVFVHENSSLYNLAIRDGSPSSKADELAMFLDDGTLSNSAVTLNQIALVDKSNVWSVYQDFKAGAGNSGSDMRFKKEVEPVTSISESIAKLDIIQYIWEHPDEERIRNTFGVKADQLLELGGIFATMVHSRGDKYNTKWVEYDRFGVLAIKAIQELLKKLGYCETEIAKLKTKL